jgi:chorismate dehydratase
VPYLNAKPLIDWFHSPECDADAEVSYVVPSQLAIGLEEGTLDVALVSIFEWFRAPELQLVPGISISADGPVKSVRLFSCKPFESLKTVALDTSSLTSVALTKVLLQDVYGIEPEYHHMPPDLDSMLAACDAGLIIGDLKLFEAPNLHVLDLGEEWKKLTGLPFVYAAWLARPGIKVDEIGSILGTAMQWGVVRLDELTAKWSREMGLPIDRVEDYFKNVMLYDLDEPKLAALQEFRRRCNQHGLVG